MNELISVIIPVYKVEDYLDQCILSVTSQTYSKLEIILVDDGSPDKCPDICEEWAARDSRIKVLHKANGGLSDARNSGLAIATGDLFAFVDSDDWLDENFYKDLLYTMHRYECDIVSGGFRYVTARQMESMRPQYIDSVVLNSKDAMAELICDGMIKQVVWNKLYKKSVIEGIQFPVGKCHEDEFWSYQIIGRANRIGIVKYDGYYYFQRSDSIMGNFSLEKRMDAIEAMCLRQEYLRRHFPDLADRGLVSMHFECMYLGQQALRMLQKEKSRIVLKKLASILFDYPITYAALKTRKVSQKVFLLMERLSFKGTCVLRNILHIGM